MKRRRGRRSGPRKHRVSVTLGGGYLSMLASYGRSFIFPFRAPRTSIARHVKDNPGHLPDLGFRGWLSARSPR